ncbi:lamin tail domain-containing protein [Candidatus Woesearchaeota archaeon]|nr:MAG: lamin tail domain-containing protein [Candidatus Woesearchaeota archaeon]
MNQTKKQPQAKPQNNHEHHTRPRPRQPSTTPQPAPCKEQQATTPRSRASRFFSAARPLSILFFLTAFTLLSTSNTSAQHFSEIMYNPAGNEAAGEFIELINATNLTGYAIGDANQNDTLRLVRQGTLPIALIVTDTYKGAQGNAWVYTAGTRIGNGLANSGDTVYLYREDTLIDTHHYTNTARENHSLEWNGTHWTESEQPGGTPGSYHHPGIVIKNETPRLQNNTSFTCTCTNDQQTQHTKQNPAITPHTCPWLWKLRSRELPQNPLHESNASKTSRDEEASATWEVWLDQPARAAQAFWTGNLITDQGTTRITWTGIEHQTLPIPPQRKGYATLTATITLEGCEPQTTTLHLPTPLPNMNDQHKPPGTMARVIIPTRQEPIGNEQGGKEDNQEDTLLAHLFIVNNEEQPRTYTITTKLYKNLRPIQPLTTKHVTVADIDLEPLPFTLRGEGNYTFLITLSEPQTAWNTSWNITRTIPEHAAATKTTQQEKRRPSAEPTAKTTAPRTTGNTIYTSPLLRAKKIMPVALTGLASTLGAYGFLRSLAQNKKNQKNNKPPPTKSNTLPTQTKKKHHSRNETDPKRQKVENEKKKKHLNRKRREEPVQKR